MTEIQTPFGPIFDGGPCEDAYDNIHERQPFGQIIKLQDPAYRAYRQACRRYARMSPVWSLRYARRRKRGRAIPLTGSWRSCARQAELYASDPGRFAHPDKTKHPRGLAIDVHTGFLNGRIRRALRKSGWEQSRPTDEPWHFSYFVKG